MRDTIIEGKVEGSAIKAVCIPGCTGFTARFSLQTEEVKCGQNEKEIHRVV